MVSTPSFGITVVEYAEFDLEGFVMFQLPLSGSPDRGMGVSVCFFKFQLPLSGSPSPIPGFSGSPRLSAAAPLRTNES